MIQWSRVLIACILSLTPLLARTQHIMTEIPAPGPAPRGLTWDGTYLWCADAEKDSIFKIDPVSGQVVHAVLFSRNFEFSRGGGIAWGGDESLWVTHRQYFYKLSASDGQEIANFHCPGS